MRGIAVQSNLPQHKPRQYESVPVGLAGRGASLAREALTGHAGGALVARVVVKGDCVCGRRRQQPLQEGAGAYWLSPLVITTHCVLAGHARTAESVMLYSRPARLQTAEPREEHRAWLDCGVYKPEGHRPGVARAVVAGRPVAVRARGKLRPDPLCIHPHPLVRQVLQDERQAAERHAVRYQQDSLPPAPTPWVSSARL